MITVPAVCCHTACNLLDILQAVFTKRDFL